MKKSMLLFFCCLISFQIIVAQSINDGKAIVDTLASSYFWGRGYTNNGVQKAALYIENQFKTIGLLPLNKKSYFQKLSYNVNTFPAKMSISIDGVDLQPGIDFIVSPESKGLQASGSLLQIDSVTFVNKKYNLLIQFKEKLTASVADFESNETIVIIDKKKQPKTIANFDINCTNKLINNFKTNNVLGYIPSKNKTDSFIIISAHYDHLGGLGSATFFPGANDNASGVATLLGLATYFSNNRPTNFNVAFICFTGEEIGLKGSKYFVENPLIPLGKIKFLFNLDLEGTGVDGATIVNGSVYTQEMLNLLQINNQYQYLKTINTRGKAANSDHYWFSQSNVPSFFMYTLGGIKAYHDVFDVASTLPLNNYINIINLVAKFVEAF
jgi:aminopeptidase YwaD